MPPLSDDAAAPQLTELGCYGLAGHSDSPADLLDQAARADELGFGAMFLSERYALKDAAVLAGAAVASSRRLGIGTAATNHNTRHPLVTATMTSTLHRMSGGRYALGLGRGIPILQDIMGLERITSAQLIDAVGILRTLWSGGAVIDHDGPAGRFPYLIQDASFDEEIPILLMAMGRRTLELAGTLADGVVLHTFFSAETTARAVATIRSAAERAGRDPASVRVWSVMATVPDHLDEASRLRRIAGRLGTYLTGYGPTLVAANGWDPGPLDRFLADDRVAGAEGALDATGDLDLLRHVDSLLPAEWLDTAATGTAEDCAEAIQGQLTTGVDSVILHGADPDELAPVLTAWRARREPARFIRLAANPGRFAS